MGRRGKRFDKKNAISFHMVARSGTDPLNSDPNVSKFVLQPSSGFKNPIPDDFPTDLIFNDGQDGEDEWYEEEARKASLEAAANDPNLFPHEYDYEAHLKPMGMGTFVAAPHTTIVAEEDIRTKEEKKHEEEIFAELGEELPKKLKYREPRNKNKKVTKDFLLSLEDDDEDTLVWDPLEDNFIDIAMTGAKRTTTSDNKEHDDEHDGDEYDEKGSIVEEEYYEDEEEEEEEDEDGEEDEEEDDDEEHEDEDEHKTKSKPKPEQRRRDDDDEEDDEDDEEEDEDGELYDEEEDDENGTINGRRKRLVDTQFDRMMAEYDDDELGELDETDPALHGTIDTTKDVIDANYDGVIEDFVTQRDREYQQNRGEQGELDVVHATTTQQIDRLEQDKDVLAEETDITVLNHRLDNMFPRPVRDNWDAESIVSTYSNLENRPTMIAVPRKEKLIHLSNKTGIPLGIIPTRPTRKQREAAAAAAAATATSTTPHDDDDNSNDDDGTEDTTAGGANLGQARDTLETPAEKKARKQAVKAARRDQRQNKKQLKQMYSSELSHQAQVDAAQKRNNPVGKKIQ